MYRINNLIDVKKEGVAAFAISKERAKVIMDHLMARAMKPTPHSTRNWLTITSHLCDDFDFRSANELMYACGLIDLNKYKILEMLKTTTDSVISNSNVKSSKFYNLNVSIVGNTRHVSIEIFNMGFGQWVKRVRERCENPYGEIEGDD